jgi:hypothetical protein
MTELNAELEAAIDALEDAFTKEELVAYADEFGVEVKHSWTKKAVAKAFAEDGVTVALINGFKPDTAEELKEAGLQPVTPGELEPAPVVEVADEDDLVLVRMTRANRSYEVRGHRYTTEHPFALVTEATADFLIEVETGFRMATPKEAREYYS